MANLFGTNGSDVIVGTPANDKISTFSGSDVIAGLAGNDTINSGAGADVISGDAGRDILIGESGNDVLAGGAGYDTLIGGSGADRFSFGFPNEGIDTIRDFVVADDTIVVAANGFGGGLKAGEVIAPRQFRLGNTAGDASDRFIYNRNTGALYFDRDGTGSAKQVQIATLANKPALTNADIFVSPQVVAGTTNRGNLSPSEVNNITNILDDLF